MTRNQVDSYWDLLKPEFEKFNIYGSPEEFTASVAAISHSIVLLYATHMCCSEVHNGGFLQLFWNSTGMVVPEAIEGFHRMGMPQLADLVENTAGLLGVPYPRDRDLRWDALLDATGHTPEELEAIFKSHDHFYKCFLEATKPLALDPLDRQFWELAANEGGGFDAAATRYAQSLRTTP